MFRRKKTSPIEITKLSSLVADNVQIVGDVIFSGGLRIDGRVDGNVICRDGEQGLLVLSESGAVTGRVKVYDAVVNGSIAGDVEVGHFIELQAGARVAGNISYRQLQLECGASVDGKLQRVDEEGSSVHEGDTRIMELDTAARATG